MPKREHTLLLLQLEESTDSRTYYDFETRAACLTRRRYSDLIEMFEAKLRASRDGDLLQYEATELLSFVESFADVVCLVEMRRDSSTRYVPHGNDWIKKQLIKLLRTESQLTSY